MLFCFVARGQERDEIEEIVLAWRDYAKHTFNMKELRYVRMHACMHTRLLACLLRRSAAVARGEEETGINRQAFISFVQNWKWPTRTHTDNTLIRTHPTLKET